MVGKIDKAHVGLWGLLWMEDEAEMKSEEKNYTGRSHNQDERRHLRLSGTNPPFTDPVEQHGRSRKVVS